MGKQTLSFLGRDSGFGRENNSAYIEYENKFILIDCGFTVFSQLKNKFDFNKYDEIDVIITHLHNDHAGTLSQFILYMYFIYNKKVNVIAKCERIKEFLDITGTPEDAYELKKENEYIKFIKTEHVKYLDAYGFELNINSKNIIYTGDTNTLEPFEPYLKNADEFYVDVSRFGGAHLKIDDIKTKLEEIQKNGTSVYLMHIDDVEYIRKITNNIFEM
mgnify:FL=1